MLSRHLNAFAALALLVPAASSCNSSMSALDRGHVSVAGLVKPLGATSSIQSPTDGVLTALRLQSRQTLQMTLSKEQLSGGNSLTLERTGPTPGMALFTKLGLPEAGASVVSGPLTISLDKDGNLHVSGEAGKIAATQGLIYGTNNLEFSIYDDDNVVSKQTVTITLKDFAAASIALTSFTTSRQISQDGQFQGWVAPLASPVVTEAQAPAATSSYLQSGFFTLINP